MTVKDRHSTFKDVLLKGLASEKKAHSVKSIDVGALHNCISSGAIECHSRHCQ